MRAPERRCTLTTHKRSGAAWWVTFITTGGPPSVAGHRTTTVAVLRRVLGACSAGVEGQLLAGNRTAPAAQAAPVLASRNRARAGAPSPTCSRWKVGRYDDFFNLGGDSILATPGGCPRWRGPDRADFGPVLCELAAAVDAKPRRGQSRTTSITRRCDVGLSPDELSADQWP